MLRPVTVTSAEPCEWFYCDNVVDPGGEATLNQSGRLFCCPECAEAFEARRRQSQYEYANDC